MLCLAPDMLHINDLTYRIGGRVLLEKASAHVPTGHKVGLVGRNGSGKSTLFKLITGELVADDGDIRLSGRARVGQVAQEAPSGAQSLLDTVLAADTERARLLEESETATDPHRIGDIHTRLNDIDAYGAPSRAARILAGLGFDDEAQARPCSDFSGGWRMRVALAAALFARPDLLLLDEPTNHLDLEATLWLMGYLKRWPGTLLVISHDRDMLNEVVDEILHLDATTLTRYVGGYDRFERTRRERLDQQSKLHARQVAERDRIQGFVDRFRAKATKARQAQSRLKMLERMEPIAAVVEEPSLKLDFPDPGSMPPPLLSLDDVSVGYDGKAVLNRLNLSIAPDERVGLLGANGNGKSTLIKLLSDRLAPLGGTVNRASKLRIGYFAQHQTDELDSQGTPYTHMAALMPDSIEPKVRAHLGRFGFTIDKANTTVANLSGGEKAKLLLALMTYHAPHIMLLDEPTNHLDIDAREALVHALNAYPGAVILVSHDPHLMNLICDRLWLVADGSCRPFEGDMDAYRKLLADAAKGKGGIGGGDGTAAPSGTRSLSKKEQRSARAAARETTKKLRATVREAEKKVETLTAACADLETRLADPALYDGPADALTALQKELADKRGEMARAEAAWLQAQEDLDALTGDAA